MSYIVNVNTKCAYCYRGDDDGVSFWQFVNFSRDGSINSVNFLRSFRVTFLHISVCLCVYMYAYLYLYFFGLDERTYDEDVSKSTQSFVSL